jgi:heat shock 70kDa protein 1/2/6/8
MSTVRDVLGRNGWIFGSFDRRAWDWAMIGYVDFNFDPNVDWQLLQVLLVGGATRMPAIRRFVTNMTGLTPRPELVDPDAAVATGAAIYAGVLSGHIQDLMVLDVWQAALMRAYAKRELKANPAVREALFGDEEGQASALPESDQESDSFDDEPSGVEEQIVSKWCDLGFFVGAIW